MSTHEASMQRLRTALSCVMNMTAASKKYPGQREEREINRHDVIR